MKKVDMTKLLKHFVPGIELYIKTEDGLMPILTGRYEMAGGSQYIVLEPMNDVCEVKHEN